MTSLEKRGVKIASAGTALFLLLFAILSFTVKFQQKPKFKEIKISLDPLPREQTVRKTAEKELPAKAIEKTQESATPVSQKKSEPVPEQKKTDSKPMSKTEPKNNNAPQKKSEPKSESAKKIEPQKPASSSPSSPIEQPQQKTVEQVSQSSQPQATPAPVPAKKQEFDWSMFDEIEGVSSSSNQSFNNSQSSVSSTFEGTAASVAESNSASSSSSSKTDYSQQEVSSSTSEALASISNTTFSSPISSTMKSSAKISASTSAAGKVSIKMTNGSMRQLLIPSDPSISISKENARLIDSTREVSVSFSVAPDGSVVVSSISIKPASILPSQVQDEIKQQLRQWIFSSVSSDVMSTAAFDYTIQVN